jgi:dUTP pyrophosphatase
MAKATKSKARKTTNGRGPKVRVVVLDHARGLGLPAYQTTQSAGFDLQAAVAEDKPMKLRPRERALVPTGLILELPKGFEGQVRPRSGLALREGLTVLNAPGTIDADYRGEVQVLLVNFGGKPVTLRRGDRIAQLIVAPVTQVSLVETGSLTLTARGAGGFGSTGVKAKSATAKRGKTKAKVSKRPR